MASDRSPGLIPTNSTRTPGAMRSRSGTNLPSRRARRPHDRERRQRRDGGAASEKIEAGRVAVEAVANPAHGVRPDESAEIANGIHERDAARGRLAAEKLRRQRP